MGNAQGVDRGCFTQNILVHHQCNKTVQETDGTLVRFVCCSESNFCNENTTLNFSDVTTSASVPPTATLTATPTTGRH